MDSKNEKTSIFSSFGNNTDFEDPKVTSIEFHLQKKQNNSPVNNFTSENLVASDNRSIPSQDSSVTYLPTIDRNSPEQFPQALLSVSEASEEELSDLEKRIISRIQSELDPEKNTDDTETTESTPDPVTAKEVTEHKPEQSETPDFPASKQDKTAQIPVPLASDQNAENQDIHGLERWLDKSPRTETGLSNWVVIGGVCIFAVCIGIIIGGIFMAGYMNRVMDQKLQAEEAYRSYKMSQTSRTDTGKDNRNGKGGPGNGNNGNGYTGVAALAFATPTSNTACDTKPKIDLSALRGGKTRISIHSQCHKAQTVSIRYANLTFRKQLDENGKLNFIFDCFAGDQHPIMFEFKNHQRIEKKLVTRDLDRITKVAVIWNNPVNLNLHAFEYMTETGEKGHIWERHPSSFEKAEQQTSQTGMGRGFISSSENFGSDNPKVEVYTFLNSPDQNNGVVKLALAYHFQKTNLHRVSCHTPQSVSIDYTTTLLIRNKDLRTSKAASILDPCDPKSFGHNGLNARAIQDLVFRR